MEHPQVVILAGPNGAGKSTLSLALFGQPGQKIHYVNADTIARGLSAYNVESMAVEAAKVMLEHIHELAERRLSFAFETTLSTRSFVPWLKKIQLQGYEVGVVFLWLSRPELAIDRVHHRKETGGHFVPDDTVRRRYERGWQNFHQLYRPFVDQWKCYNNDRYNEPVLIAEMKAATETIYHHDLWDVFSKGPQP